MRTAIVGCGSIASIHLSHLLRLRLSQVVALCDLERERAVKMARSFNIPKVYGDLGEMLSLERPDVVHVLTPPASHAALTVQCLKAGAHVLVEKPMALGVEEADLMIAAAREAGKTLCVDHCRLFAPPVLRARRMLEAGDLGQLVSVDFYQGFGLPPGVSWADFKKQWLQKLPGGVLQDLAPHCLYSLLEFVGNPIRFHVLAKHVGILPGAPAEEIRITMEGEKILGTGTISLAAQPYMSHFTLYGSRRTVRANLEDFTLVVKSQRFSNPMLRTATSGIDEGARMALATAGAVLRFALGKLPRRPDIAEIIRHFYRSVQTGGRPPVTIEQGREVVRLTQETVRAIQESAPRPAPEATGAAVRASAPSAATLITGATGFVGGALARRLLSRGVRVRALARPSTKVSKLKDLGVEVVVGDAADRTAVDAAVRGTQFVIHCAARTGTQGTWEEFCRDTVRSTENVLRAAHEATVKRLIYMSSLGVYGIPEHGDAITEASPYDSKPGDRGHYSRAKIEAETLVLQFVRDTGLPVTLFRPGLIFGPGQGLPTASLAFPSPFRHGFLVIGSSKRLLALNYIENLVDALELALEHNESIGKQYNIVDDEGLTSGEYHRVRGRIDGTRAIFVPSLPFRLAAPGIEVLVKRAKSGKLASFSSHALARALRSVRYDTRAVRRELGWEPRVCLEEALRATLKPAS
jgi:predicted dehydrogenase/nucleoside-diphosphate-sugar epimerase